MNAPQSRTIAARQPGSQRRRDRLIARARGRWAVKLITGTTAVLSTIGAGAMITFLGSTAAHGSNAESATSNNTQTSQPEDVVAAADDMDDTALGDALNTGTLPDDPTTTSAVSRPATSTITTSKPGTTGLSTTTTRPAQTSLTTVKQTTTTLRPTTTTIKPATTTTTVKAKSGGS